MLTALQRKVLIVLGTAMLCLFTIRWYWAQWQSPGMVFHFLPEVKPPVLNAEVRLNHEPVWDTFNPNTVSAAQLIQLGLNKKTANIIVHYREKGGRFKTPTDLLRIYGMDTQWVQKALPFIVLSTTVLLQPSKQTFTRQPEVKQVQHIELNSADSISLIKLPGIGPAFAHRILKYRSLLGGFTTCNQLLEVYGFRLEQFELLRQCVYVNAAVIQKINLNTDDFKTINRHPYISYELTKQIFDWKRKTVFTPENTRELINDNELWIKLKPYLQF
jgi:competence protein ComEA